MEYDVLLIAPAQSNAMGLFFQKNQTELDALNPDLSIWQQQWLTTYNDGELKYQNVFPKDALVSRDYIQIWEYQNKYGEDYTDVSTTYSQPSPQDFVNYYIETDGNGLYQNAFFYNDNSGVYKYPFAWDLPYALSMYKATGVPQRVVKIAVGATGFNNNAQSWDVSPVNKPGDNLYKRGLEEIAKVKAYFATEGNTIRKWKILVEQGEANNTTAEATYKAALKAALDGWIAEIGTGDVQVIIRKTGLDADGSNNAGNAQVTLASEEDYIYCWDDYTFTSDADGVDFSRTDPRAKYYRQFGDVYHISPIGQWRMGLTIAEWVQTNVTGY